MGPIDFWLAAGVACPRHVHVFSASFVNFREQQRFFSFPCFLALDAPMPTLAQSCPSPSPSRRSEARGPSNAPVHSRFELQKV